MCDDFSVRILQQDDLPEIMALINPLYKIHRPSSYFSWQLFNNVHPTIFYGAFSLKKELAGIFGIQKRFLTNNLSAGQMTGVNLGEKWRGKGLFKTMGYSAINYFPDLDLIFIFANERAVAPCKSAFDLQFLSPISALELTSFNRIHDIAILSCEQIDVTTPFPAKSFSHGLRTAFETGAPFRRWRYALSPIYDYYKLSLGEDVFSIVKIFHPPEGGKSVGDVVDWEYPSDDRKAIFPLIHCTASWLFKKNVRTITTWALPGTALAAECEKIGFSAGYKTYFGLKMNRQTPINPYALDFWYLNQSDATNY